MRHVALPVLIIISIIASSFQLERATEDWLSHPFDLQKFKNKKGQSNSGGMTKKEYYFRPEGKGMYYRFFLFQPLSGYEYLSSDQSTREVHLENGLQLITFKPLGKYQYKYIDPTETLIEVHARYNDRDLPELAFIGLDTTFIKTKLGNNFWRKEDCFIYAKENNALVLKITKGRIEWLRYSKLKYNLTKDNIPVALLTEKN